MDIWHLCPSSQLSKSHSNNIITYNWAWSRNTIGSAQQQYRVTIWGKRLCDYIRYVVEYIQQIGLNIVVFVWPDPQFSACLHIINNLVELIDWIHNDDFISYELYVNGLILDMNQLEYQNQNERCSTECR